MIKEKTIFRITAFLVTLLLVAGIFGGCSSDKEEAYEGLYIEGFSESETAAAEEILLRCGIVPVKTVKVEAEGSEGNPFASIFQPYDITGEDGKVYRVPVNLAGNQIVTIVDTETSEILYTYADSNEPDGEDIDPEDIDSDFDVEAGAGK